MMGKISARSNRPKSKTELTPLDTNNKIYAQMRTYQQRMVASKKCAIVFIIVFEAFSLLLDRPTSWWLGG